MEQLKTWGFGFGVILLLIVIGILFSESEYRLFTGAILLGFSFVCFLLGIITAILQQMDKGDSAL